MRPLLRFVMWFLTGLSSVFLILVAVCATRSFSLEDWVQWEVTAVADNARTYRVLSGNVRSTLGTLVIESNPAHEEVIGEVTVAGRVNLSWNTHPKPKAFRMQDKPNLSFIGLKWWTVPMNLGFGTRTAIVVPQYALIILLGVLPACSLFTSIRRSRECRARGFAVINIGKSGEREYVNTQVTQNGTVNPSEHAERQTRVGRRVAVRLFRLVVLLITPISCFVFVLTVIVAVRSYNVEDRVTWTAGAQQEGQTSTTLKGGVVSSRMGTIFVRVAVPRRKESETGAWDWGYGASARWEQGAEFDEGDFLDELGDSVLGFRYGRWPPAKNTLYQSAVVIPYYAILLLVGALPVCRFIILLRARIRGHSRFMEGLNG